MVIKIVIFLLTFAWALGSPAYAEDATSQKQEHRVAVLVLPFENLTVDTNSDYWSFAITATIGTELASADSVRVLPDSSVQFAFQELKLKPGQHLEEQQVRRLGETIEARKVVWGSYAEQGEKKKISVQLLDVATGKASGNYAAESDSWLKLLPDTGERLLHELGVTPTADQAKSIAYLRQRSPKALEWFARGYADSQTGKPMPVCEPEIVQALEADPKFDLAHYALAMIYLNEGKPELALEQAELGIKSSPNNGRKGHFFLGAAYCYLGRLNLARHELKEAIRNNPDDAQAYELLSEIAEQENKIEESIQNLKRAVEIEPYSGSIHAELGNAYTYLRESEKAVEQFRLAERYSHEDIVTEQMLGMGYARMDDLPKAVEHLEQCVMLAKARSVENASIDSQRKKLAELKLRLTPQFVSAEVPESKLNSNPNEAIKKLLSPEESALAINPLALEPAAENWALELTAKGTNDLEKAKALFHELVRHINLGDPQQGARTAIETFHAWHDERAVFSCQEYAYLFVPLARKAGLKAYCVRVELDYRGRPVPHMCAGLLIDGKALLVDPSYHWFGAPHKKFQFLTDVQVIGFHLSQAKDLARKRVAVKLFPNSSMVHVNLALALEQANDRAGARRELDVAAKFGTDKWLICYAKALVATDEDDWPEVVKLLNECLSYNPEFPKANFWLGAGLLQQKEYVKARTAFRAYLEKEDNSELAEKARREIARINSLLEHN